MKANYFNCNSSSIVFLSSLAPFFFSCLFLLIFLFSESLTAQTAATRIYTDWNGYWSSNAATPAGNRPDSQNNLLAFRLPSGTYSTGVNDAALTANGVTFTPSTFKNLPINAINSNAATFFMQGANIDGNLATGTLVPPLAGATATAAERASKLTDGIRGLSLGTGIANINAGAASFTVGTGAINTTAIGDGIPDFVISQIAVPHATAFDKVKFVNSAGVTVGTDVSIGFSGVSVMGTYLLDRFQMNGALAVANETRDIRLVSLELSNMGITAVNASQVAKLVVTFSGESDCAFIAVNSASLQTPAPALALVKTAVVGGTGAVGDVITYTFAVTNTGNVPLTNVSVTDPLTGIVLTGNPIATLAVGATNSTIKGTYTIKQSDVDAGNVTNSASASGTDPDGNTGISDISGSTILLDDPLVTTLPQTSSLALVKTAVVAGTGAVGDVITYTFAVTNTGNVTLSNIAVTDAMVGLTITNSPIASLAPGATNSTVTGTYTITQSDIDAGKVVNTATATGKNPQGVDVSDVSGTANNNNTPTDTPLTQTSSLALVKTAVVAGTGAVGDVITYTFAVTNTGNVTLSNIAVTDAMVGLTITNSPIASLAPGATNSTVTGTYTITQSDIDAGKVVNTATATGKNPQGVDVSDVSGTANNNNTPTDTPLTQTSSLALVKTAVVAGTGAVGDVITYTFAVTNTGNVTLSTIAVTDAMVGLTITNSPIASLAPGATNSTVTGTYTITQSDIDAGKVVNTATATGKNPQGVDVSDVSGTANNNNTPTDTPLTQTSSLALVKTAVVAGTGAVGDVITYTFAVTNTGNVTLSTIAVTDAMVGLTITNSPIASLAPGATNSTVTGTYTITQSDIDAGKVVNTATATGKNPQGVDVSDVSGTANNNNTPTDTPLTQTSSLALVKTAVVAGTGAVGDVITYTFAVTNTGNVTLNNIVVTDAMVGLTITNSPIASLAPGATNSTVTGTYTITQSDIDAGKVVNTATATGKNPQGVDVSDVSGTANNNNTPTDTPLTQTSSLALVKTASVAGTGAVGDVITYTFAVTNTGNVTLSTIAVTDVMVGLTITNSPIASLAPGATNSTVTGTYTITQSDIDAGKVVNTATATGKNPQGVDVSDVSGTANNNNTPTDTPLTQTSSLALVKTAVVAGTGAVGDVITYTFAVTNTGNVTLSNIAVTDAMVGLTITNSPIASLAPGATNSTVTGTYTITQSDIDAGKVVNTATATGKNPQGVDVSDVSGTANNNDMPTDTPLTQTSSLALVKTAVVAGTGAVGDVITYTFAVTNTGNVTLNNIAVTDAMVGLTITNSPIASLAPGATNSTVTGTYTITQSDIDAGKVVNTATATGKNPQGVDVSDVSGTANNNNTPTDTPLTQTSSLALVKTAVVAGTGAVGDVITYTFAVTNTGNVTLNNIVVTDVMVGLTITNSPIASLAPGATNSTVTGTYTITQSDIDAGKVVNTATATGKNPQGVDVSDVSGTANNNNTPTDTPLTQTSSLALVKTAVVAGTGAVGDVITYTFAVTNTGNVTLSNIAVTDAMVGLTITNSPIASLAPGATNSTVTGTYTITQSDIDAGKVVNTATATGKNPQGVDVSDVSGTANNNNTPTDTPLTQTSSLALVKTASVAGTGAVGDVITYTFAVTNTGNVTLSTIAVTDVMVGLTITNSPIASLAPGATNSTVTGTYTITQSDIDAGKVVNTATATGKNPQGVDVSDVSGTANNNNTPTDTPLTQTSSLALVKTAVVAGTGAVGDVITYTFAVTNTGNVTLSNIAVTDAMVGLTITNSPIASLAPGATNSTVTGTYTIKQSDIDAGKVVNTATATGKNPQGVDVSDVSGTANNNDTPTDTPLTQTSSLALVKTASVAGTGAVGDVITYTFAVNNTGNVTLSTIAVTDVMVGLTITNSPIASLAPGATNSTVTGTYTIKQSDIDAGKVVNTATATGKNPQGVDVSDVSGTANNNNTPTDTPLTQTSSLALVKTASVAGTGAVGDVITYTFAVTNTGNVTLNNTVVTDAMVGLTITNSPIASLAPGATNSTVTGTYTITQSDIDAGKVVNTATATGKNPQGVDVSDVSGTANNNNTPTDTPLTQTSSLALVKTAVVAGTGAVGDVITYTFAVTNTGNDTLNNIAVTDAMVGLTITNSPIASLAPGATNSTVTGTYTIKQSDIDAGKVVNTATATGKNPQGVDVSDVSGTANNNDTPTDTPLTQTSSLALVKTASVAGTGAVGDVITYTFAVNNTGNVTLSTIAVTDVMVGLTITNSPIASLAPGATNSTVTGTYTIKQSDIDAGKVVNTATATGKNPQGVDVSDVSGTANNNNTPTDTPLTQTSSLALVKTASVAGTGAVGDVITYTFAVTNTGNVTLNNTVVTDAMVGLTITNSPIASLAPGATNSTVTGTYTITQSDIDAGKVVNTATATGKNPQGVDVSDVSGTANNNNTPTDTPLTQTSSLALVKTAVVAGTGAVGDVITYTFAVTNTGNDTLNNIVVTDAMVGLTITNSPIASLAPGATNSTVTGTYTITQSDIDAGKVVNTATATGKNPQGVDVSDVSGTANNNDTPTEIVIVKVDANNDALLPIIGAFGGTTDNILLNDTVNGSLLTAATLNTVTVSQVGSYPAGITINTDGTLNVAAGTAIGSYVLQYQICSVAAPLVCDTASITIDIERVPDPAPPVIFADTDLAGPIASSTTTQTVLNVLSNDFVELDPATLSNVAVTTVTADPSGYMTLSADGSIALAANTPAGTYTLTYSICELLRPANCATAVVTVTVTCNSSTAISGKVFNASNNAPLANVPVTLKPINTTTGPVLLRLTKADGSYSFTGMIPGDYVIQVKDANLNAAQGLFNTTPSFLILKVEDCNFQQLDFGYDTTDLLVLGDFVWYDLNNNGLQDEWYDANNDGLVTQNLPDSNGVVDFSQWEWIDFNGDGSYKGLANAGELNAAGFGNGTTNVPNIFVTGPNGFSRSITMGVEGYWRTRAPRDNYGEYKIEFIKESNFETASAAISGSGLVKVLPSPTVKGSKSGKSASFIACGLTTNSVLFAQFTSTQKVNLDLDFGISCKTYADLVATDDDAGTIEGVQGTTGFFNVLLNDTFDTLPVQASQVLVTVSPSPYFTISSSGDLSSLANIPAGSYTLNYSICEKANPTNCSQASITIVVVKPSIALVKTAKFNDENNDGFAQAGETITYRFEVSNTGSTTLSNVTINDPLPGVVMRGGPISLAIGERNSTEFEGTYTIKQSDINSGSVSNQATAYGTSSSGTVVEDKSDELNVLNDNPTVLTVSGCAIQVFNAVSPDGSGQNDKLYIRGLECYPENSVEIFNRWGVLVFERQNYNNADKAFRGISEGRVTVEQSQELPVGTYFYILKYKDSSNNAIEKSGYLYLNRK